MDDVTRQAKSVTDRLNSCADHLATTIRDKELCQIYADTCRQAGALLKKYDTEVSRLRQAIGCYDNGRLTRAELRRIARSWNDDGSAKEGGGHG